MDLALSESSPVRICSDLNPVRIWSRLDLVWSRLDLDRSVGPVCQTSLSGLDLDQSFGSWIPVESKTSLES